MKTRKAKAKTKRKAKRDASTNGSEKMVRTAIYEGSDGVSIFVPSEAMWEFRDALRPTKVCKRARIKRTRWDRWRLMFGSDSWQIRYRFGAQLPEGKEFDYLRGNQTAGQQPRDSTRLIVDREMVAFRRSASAGDACKSIHRRAGDGLSTSNISVWMNDHRDVPGFENWLRYQSEPVIETAKKLFVRQCRIAWNYHRLLQAIDVSHRLYSAWYGLFPADDVYGWARWLYGGAVPERWWIVPEKALELKSRLYVTGIARAADDAKSTANKNWKRDRYKAAALEAAIQAFRDCRPRFVERHLEKHSQAWQELTPERFGGGLSILKDAILRYAAKSTMASALADVDLSRGGWNGWIGQLKKIGGEVLVKRFHAFIHADEPPSNRVGILSQGLFIPTPGMREFRKAALRVWADQHIDAVERSVSPECFKVWFLAWVLPGKHRDRVLERDGSVVRLKPIGSPPVDGDGRARTAATGEGEEGAKTAATETPEAEETATKATPEANSSDSTGATGDDTKPSAKRGPGKKSVAATARRVQKILQFVSDQSSSPTTKAIAKHLGYEVTPGGLKTLLNEMRDDGLIANTGTRGLGTSGWSLLPLGDLYLEAATSAHLG